jgi:hypothetical protein
MAQRLESKATIPYAPNRDSRPPWAHHPSVSEGPRAPHWWNRPVRRWQAMLVYVVGLAAVGFILFGGVAGAVLLVATAYVFAVIGLLGQRLLIPRTRENGSRGSTAERRARNAIFLAQLAGGALFVAVTSHLLGITR